MRPAKADDFNDNDLYLKFRKNEHINIDDSARHQLDIAQTSSDVTAYFKKNYGIGAIDVKILFNEYKGLKQAKADFDAGLPVFINY